jgi:FKBP-type peptidyl-prolyl cis-trans isomerase (trigger factor)
MEKNYNITMKDLEGSRIEITAEISAEEFAAARPQAIKHLQEHADLPGFRKGMVPESILLARIGEGAILEEMAEVAIGRAYPTIVISNKLDVIGRPDVKVTKLAIGSPLTFTITTAIFPKFVLPEYKSIAKKITAKKEEATVDADEVTKTINELKRLRAKSDAQKEGKEYDESLPLPELNDEWVKTLGAFENIAEFEEKLKENIIAEKTRQSRDKVRVAIMQELVKETTMELPEILIDQELARMEEEFSADIARMGMELPKYLAQVGKTREDMHKEWRDDAIARAKTQIIAAKIAEEEKLEPSKEDMEREITALSTRYPNAQKERIEGFVRMILENEKVFSFLENQK